MKNYFKKFSVMFVMAFVLVFGWSISAFAADQSIKINNTTLNFDKIIYISTTGNDTTGDGTEGNPFLTFDKAYQNAVDNSAIVLGDGIFNATNYAQNYINESKTISIIGNADKTTIIFPSSPENPHFRPKGTIKFYRLTLTFNGNGFSGIQGDGASPAMVNIFFYNVNFVDNGDSYPLNGSNWTHDGHPNSFNLYAYNSNFKTNSKGLSVNSQFTNCATNQQVLTSYTDLMKVNTTPLYSVNYDNSFTITNAKWKNSGTGKNPDGTQANIGVYGGEFAWGNYSGENKAIMLNQSSMNLILGNTQQLTTTPAGAQVTWKSSDSSIATVDPTTGKVTGVKEGTCTITATTPDGATATCEITVTPKGTDPIPTPEPTDTDKIVNIAHAKGDNTNNPGGDVIIIFHGAADTTLSVVKTADVKEVWVGDTVTYTIVVTNTGTKTAKAVVVNDPAPNHIDFNVNAVTTTQGTVDTGSTSKNIVVNVGDIPPAGTVTITIPATVIA